MDWDKKKSMCVFRGTASGCGVTEDTNMRLKAALMSVDPEYGMTDILDAKLTGWNDKEKMYNGKLTRRTNK